MFNCFTSFSFWWFLLEGSQRGVPGIVHLGPHPSSESHVRPSLPPDTRSVGQPSPGHLEPEQNISLPQWSLPALGPGCGTPGGWGANVANGRVSRSTLRRALLSGLWLRIRDSWSGQEHSRLAREGCLLVGTPRAPGSPSRQPPQRVPEPCAACGCPEPLEKRSV